LHILFDVPSSALTLWAGLHEGYPIHPFC